MTEDIKALLMRVQSGEVTGERFEAILKNLKKGKAYRGETVAGMMKCKASRRVAQNSTWRFAKVKYNFGDGFKVDYHPPRSGIKPPWMWVRMQDYGV